MILGFDSARFRRNLADASRHMPAYAVPLTMTEAADLSVASANVVAQLRGDLLGGEPCPPDDAGRLTCYYPSTPGRGRTCARCSCTDPRYPPPTTRKA